MTLKRREFLAGAAAAAAAALAAESGKPLRNIGGAPAGFPVRRRVLRAASKPFDFIDHCHSLGLGVVETVLPADGDTGGMRRKVEGYGMRLILDVGVPAPDGKDADAYEAKVKAAKDCGAIALHAAMTGRRYEDFDNFEVFRRSVGDKHRSIELAEPILRRHRLPLAIENHKGWRSLEQAAWMKKISSEWVGVHFDFGNNISLCEEPAETLRNLLPYTIAGHIKDMAVEMYEDGFLLSEVPLGEGILDLKSMAGALWKKDPNLPLNLEIITRDPLKIPVFTKKYWVTFDDSFSPLPGRDLAATLNLVRRNPPKHPLPQVTGLSNDQQLKLEDEFIARSIRYASQSLL